MSALRRVSTAMSAQRGATPVRCTSTIWSQIQAISSGQVSKVAARTWPLAVPGGACSSPSPASPSSAPLCRSGPLSTLATSRIELPLRRFTVSANRRLGRPSTRRKSSAKEVMLLAAAPRQP